MVPPKIIIHKSSMATFSLLHSHQIEEQRNIFGNYSVEIGRLTQVHALSCGEWRGSASNLCGWLQLSNEQAWIGLGDLLDALVGRTTWTPFSKVAFYSCSMIAIFLEFWKLNDWRLLESILDKIIQSLTYKKERKWLLLAISSGFSLQLRMIRSLLSRIQAR